MTVQLWSLHISWLVLIHCYNVGLHYINGLLLCLTRGLAVMNSTIFLWLDGSCFQMFCICQYWLSCLAHWLSSAKRQPFVVWTFGKLIYWVHSCIIWHIRSMVYAIIWGYLRSYTLYMPFMTWLSLLDCVYAILVGWYGGVVTPTDMVLIIKK